MNYTPTDGVTRDVRIPRIIMMLSRPLDLFSFVRVPLTISEVTDVSRETEK